MRKLIHRTSLRHRSSRKEPRGDEMRIPRISNSSRPREAHLTANGTEAPGVRFDAATGLQPGALAGTHASTVDAAIKPGKPTGENQSVTPGQLPRELQPECHPPPHQHEGQKTCMPPPPPVDTATSYTSVATGPDPPGLLSRIVRRKNSLHKKPNPGVPSRDPKCQHAAFSNETGVGICVPVDEGFIDEAESSIPSPPEKTPVQGHSHVRMVSGRTRDHQPHSHPSPASGTEAADTNMISSKAKSSKLKLRNKPSFRGRFWTASAANDFGGESDGYETSKHTRSQSHEIKTTVDHSRRVYQAESPVQPTPPKKQAPYVPRHAASDFARTATTKPLHSDRRGHRHPSSSSRGGGRSTNSGSSYSDPHGPYSVLVRGASLDGGSSQGENRECDNYQSGAGGSRAADFSPTFGGGLTTLDEGAGEAAGEKEEVDPLRCINPHEGLPPPHHPARDVHSSSGPGWLPPLQVGANLSMMVGEGEEEENQFRSFKSQQEKQERHSQSQNTQVAEEAVSSDYERFLARAQADEDRAHRLEAARRSWRGAEAKRDSAYYSGTVGKYGSARTSEDGYFATAGYREGEEVRGQKGGGGSFAKMIADYIKPPREAGNTARMGVVREH